MDKKTEQAMESLATALVLNLLMGDTEPRKSRRNRVNRCYQCESRLSSDGECPRGCTESDDYYAGKGFYEGY
jgi:hypothetical protein